MDAYVCSKYLNKPTSIFVCQIFGLCWPGVLVYIKQYINTKYNNTVSGFFHVCILIKLEVEYCYNVTFYKYFIKKVYDFEGQPSYVVDVVSVEMV